MRSHKCLTAIFCSIVIPGASSAAGGQPAEPIDITPINGDVYYIVNQLSGLQADLNNNSTKPGDDIVQEFRSFTNLSQRWTFTLLSGGAWQIGNVGNGLCLDAEVGRRAEGREAGGAVARRHLTSARSLVQNLCTAAETQQWNLTPTNNGYYTIASRSTGLLIDLAPSPVAEGVPLGMSPLSGVPTQSQQWLLRPAFFRGVDNALLEKQEAARATAGMAWWNDAGQQQDVLQMMKNHGVNMVRLRPSSAPPYVNPSQPGCSGNACYAETDAQDLDLARRAKNLGMSIELTLLFDGGSSASVPPAWAGDTQLSQLESDLYAYVKAELLSWRKAGTMPDLVAIGNEVDTGFLGLIGSPTGADFGGFAALQIKAMQAVQDAALDPSAGPSIPAPLTCIHITPAWDLTQFFTLANQFDINNQYDAICQSYYPIYHGPLTDAQAAASNPGGKPVEQDVLVKAANSIGRPIFIMETGEHYENGFDANDPWYAPPTPALQRQFLLDLESAEKSLPNNLGMGMEYWDPAGVNIPKPSGGFLNGDNLPDAIYIWNGLTLFDNADSMLLPGIDALGGKLDQTLSYKFINRSNGQILTAGAPLDTLPDNANPTTGQQWRMMSNNDGYFQIASLSEGTIALGAGQEWDIVSAAGGYFQLVNRASGTALAVNGAAVDEEPRNSASAAQQWQIVPVY